MRILLTHTPTALSRYYGDEALAELRQLGDVVLHQGSEPLNTEALIAAARACDVIIADRQTPGEAAVFSALPDLKAFLRCAMDIRNIDVAAASRSGVLVTRATAGFIDSVVELAIGLMVDLARGVSTASAAYHAGTAPDIRMGRQLSGSTIGIIGFGAIGQRLGALAHAMGMDVLASDPYRTDFPHYVTPVPLNDLLARSHFVVCLAPASSETQHMMNARSFAAMAPGNYFINLARGELVDEKALRAALDSGHLAAAAMDVGSAPDQMPEPSLAKHPRMVATPHIGGLTPAAVQHQAFDTVRQAAALNEGRLPEGAVNSGAAHRLIKLGVAV